MAVGIKKRKIRRFHVALKDREYLIANLSALLGAAVPLGEALQSLQATTRSGIFRQALLQIQQDVDEGMPLWKAFDRSGVVSQQTLALVRLGEESGHLVDNLAVAAEQEEKQHEFSRKVHSALLYPGFVLGLTLVVGIAVAWFLLPKLAETFAQMNVTLPLISRIFINFGIFLKDNGIWAVPVSAVVMLLLGYILFGLPQTKGIGTRLLYLIPGVSRLLHEVEIARFGYMVGILLEAGLSVTQTLKLAEQSTTAPAYRKLYKALALDFEEGYGFRTAFDRYKHTNKLLPPTAQQVIIAGERSGTLAAGLKNVGSIYSKKADTTTANLAVILEPVLLVIMAGGVLAVAVAVILPIYSLVGGLNGV
ncbi:MAG: type secretion system family protein [Candidatus Saccharibacteria bacterium]|nr:type secretion system family protein [Candidatus Saccharibacteria bacterium]